MGSKSAATSPTGSSHGTPTHQSKPQTLDPFADLGTLGTSTLIRLKCESYLMLMSTVAGTKAQLHIVSMAM